MNEVRGGRREARRLAWFSPVPPVRTGIAAYSADLVEALRRRGHEVDLYPSERAHDFPWQHRQRPYELIVYQFGNSSHHDYQWAYALRYPGLVVLHDTRLHHARAAFLLREQRADHYRAEFRWSHPDVPADAAELAVAGFDSRLFYEWGMVRALIESSRLVAVHGEATRRELVESIPNFTTPNSQAPNSQTANSQAANSQTANSQAANSQAPNSQAPNSQAPNSQAPNSQAPNSQAPNSQTANSQAANSQAANSQAANSQAANSQAELFERVVSIRIGHGQLVRAEDRQEARRRIRARHGLADDAVVFGLFGGLTPEKRIPQVLRALRALVPYAPAARLLLGGAPAAHYDLAAEIAALGLEDRVTVAGYLETDAELTDHLAACDVSLNLRWPTARETSGPWLRALAAGTATIITDLVHLGNVPSLDPRTWGVQRAGSRELDAGSAVTIAIDILDEDHSLRLAMRRLAADGDLRAQLGRAGQEWWTREHAIEVMADDYERVMNDAAARPDPRVTLPAHMRNDADATLRALLEPFGVGDPLRGRDPRSRP